MDISQYSDTRYISFEHSRPLHCSVHFFFRVQSWNLDGWSLRVISPALKVIRGQICLDCWTRFIEILKFFISQRARIRDNQVAVRRKTCALYHSTNRATSFLGLPFVAFSYSFCFEYSMGPKSRPAERNWIQTTFTTKQETKAVA